jgi:hypothetical protein
MSDSSDPSSNWSLLTSVWSGGASVIETSAAAGLNGFAASMAGSANGGSSISFSVSVPGSGLVFNNTITTGFSQAFENCIIAAEQTFAGTWTNSVTLNLDFRAANQGNSGFVSRNSWPSFVTVDYATLRAALVAHDQGSTYGQLAAAALPQTDPSGGAGWSLPEAYARMLGLSTAAPAVDDVITLNTYYDPTYGQDVINDMTHEISEGGMGRVGGLGDQNSVWSTMDLFRYSASGQPDYTDGRDGVRTYFSYNGGQTLSSSAGLSFNNEYNIHGVQVNTGDTADFIQQDVFGTAESGETNTLSPTDIQMMDVLGWTPFSAPSTPTSPPSTPTGPLPPDITISLVDDTGVSSSDLITSDPAVTGGGIPNATVTISANGNILGTTTANSAGTWTFTPTGLVDGLQTLVASETGPGGTVSVSLTFTLDTTPPMVLLDRPLLLQAGATATIPGSLLQFADNLSSDAQETYTVTSAPQDGALLLNGAPVSTFTQGDIDNGLVSYQETTPGASADSLGFTVSDAAGNTTGPEQFGFNIASSAFAGSQFGFFEPPGIPLNAVYTPNGSNLPAATAGAVNLEVVTAPTQASYALPQGYQGVATFPGGTGKALDLLVGDINVADSGPADSITGGPGFSTIGGGQGDTILGGSNDEFIDGTQGNQSITGGSAGDETIFSGSFDTVAAGGAAAVAIGGVPFDILSGGTGTDFLDGSRGNQSVIGGSAGNETIYSAANDTVNGGGAANETIGGVQQDVITGGTGTEFIDGSGGNQSIIVGSAGNETIWGGNGDTINGSGANVTIGGVFGDTITGGTGTEFIDGSQGSQSITGGSAGNETIWSGAGDTINGGSGANVTIGGVQQDAINGGTGTVFIDGSQGNQSITVGGAGSETIWGGNGDTITGGAAQGLIGFVTTPGAGAEFFSDNGTTAANSLDTLGGFSQTAGDLILLNGASSASAVVASAQTAGGNTTITFGDGSKLTLLGVTSVNNSFFG